MPTEQLSDAGGKSRYVNKSGDLWGFKPGPQNLAAVFCGRYAVLCILCSCRFVSSECLRSIQGSTYAFAASVEQRCPPCHTWAIDGTRNRNRSEVRRSLLVIITAMGCPASDKKSFILM